jgi:hypothetical protein
MRSVIAGTAGALTMTSGAGAWQTQSRREVSIGGRRIRVIDGHA